MSDLKPENEITEVDFSFQGAHLALTHKSQGFSANGRPEALLIKSEEVEPTAEAKQLQELIKAGDAEVMIETDMVTFLTRWMGLWRDDAEALATLLGYNQEEVQDEVNEYQDYLQGKIEGISLLKAESVPDKAKASDIIKLKKFIDSNESLKNSLSEGNSEVKIEKKKSSQKPSEIKKEKGDITMSDVEKAQVEIQKMQDRLAELEKAQALDKAKIEAFEKAEQERAEKLFAAKVETYSFVTEEERPEFIKTLMKIQDPAVMLMLDKAQAAISAVSKSEGATTTDAKPVEKSGVMAILEKQFPNVK